MYMPLPDIMGEKTFVPNPIPGYDGPEAAPTGANGKALNMGIAFFQKCCYDRGFFDQTPINTCDVTTLPELLNEQIKDFSSLGLDKIGTCKTMPKVFNQTYVAITSAQCDVATTMLVTFSSSLKIPTISFTIETALRQLYPDEKPIAAPLVGYHRNWESDPAKVAKEGYGFGCGLGYAKGVMWMSELWFKEHVNGMSTGVLGVGATSVVVVLFGFLVAGVSASEGDEGDVKRTQGGSTLQAAVSVNQMPSHGSFHTLQQKTSFTSGAPVAARNMALDLNQMLAKLKNFYAVHDANKSESFIMDVAKWGTRKGYDALNENLRKRYNADLTTAYVPQQAKHDSLAV